MWTAPWSQKTFRPKKTAPFGQKGAQLTERIQATLGSGNLRDAVQLPLGEDRNEWLAVNTVDFFNAVSLLYGTLGEYCTDAACPVMGAGPKYEYRWADGVRVRKPLECSAPQYVAYLMEWVESQLDDPTVFPPRAGMPFPATFEDTVRTILKRLFRVYAHIYHSHLDAIQALEAEAHLNTCLKHLVYFVRTFALIDEKELAPLQDVIDLIARE